MRPDFVVPPAAEAGDRVAILAPSSGAAATVPDVLSLGLDRLSEVFDLQPVVFPTARQSGDFLRSNPKARAADIHAAFRDPDVSAVFDLDFGRTNPTVPIPMGGDVEIDPRSQTTRFS